MVALREDALYRTSLLLVADNLLLGALVFVGRGGVRMRSPVVKGEGVRPLLARVVSSIGRVGRGA